MKRLTQQEFEKRVFDVFGNRLIILGEYKNSRTKIKARCNVCRYIWETNPNTLQNGHGCPLCANNLPKTTEQFKREVYDLVKDEYEILSDYKNTHEKILFKHNTCGEIFKMEPNAFLQGQRCPVERYSKSSKSNIITQGNPNEKNKQLKEICDNEGYEIVKSYTNAQSNLILRHCKCGSIIKPRPYHFLVSGVRCSCETESKGERVIRQWLENNNIIFKEQYRFDDCKGIEKPLPFDFAIFDSTSLICLIEFDGLQHFMPKFGKENYQNTKRNDDIKNNYCNDKNIHLIRIKYNRSTNMKIFGEKIVNELIEKLSNINMTIPSQAYEETLGRCND